MTNLEDDVFFDEDYDRDDIPGKPVSEDDFDDYDTGDFKEVDFINEKYKKEKHDNIHEGDVNKAFLFGEDASLDDFDMDDEEVEELCDIQDSDEDDFKDGDSKENNEKQSHPLSEHNQEESGEEIDDDEEESVCFVCRRTESVTGKQLKLPNNISICNDCMQKTLDAIGNVDMPPGMDVSSMFSMPYQGMQNLTTENEGEGEDNKSKLPPNMPRISFLNMSDLSEAIPGRQKIKKKKKSTKPLIDIKNVPRPHVIKAKLDEFVVGQEYAKKVISVAVYNHYKRVATQTMDEIEIEKSNMLMIGPTGCGKTYLVKTLAKLLDVPLAIADATSLTEAGYIGDDIESVLSKLLAAADNDVEKAEMGIVFIDEIDKIARKKETTSRDVSGESVQQGMLKLLEGADVEVPVGANSKNAMVPLTTINTRNILFICGGAFPDLEEIIKQRLKKTTAIGYGADLKDKYDHDENIMNQVTTEDLKQFGMIPEFLGRLPILYTLSALDKEMYVRILKEPKNAILKQYQKLLALDEVDLDFDDEALFAIADLAMEKDTGARALRAIIEKFMLDIMYEIPKDDNIGRVIITREYIEGIGGPRIEIRGGE